MSPDELSLATGDRPPARDARPKPVVLVAEDDADDRFFIMRTLREDTRLGPAHAVKDGVELLDYLARRNEYRDPATSPRPTLILLDLNMPRKNGLEALQEIKSDPELRGIPVVVLTTSPLEADIARSYDLGASAYIIKPMHFSELRRVARALDAFWTGVAQLPHID